MATETIRSGKPISGSYDIEDEARSIPPSYKVKGMFFQRLCEILDSDLQKLLPTLEGPPRGGRYVGFRDYPGSDYARLSGAAARKRYPHVELREASRRLAHEDFDVFASSTLGRVTLAVVWEARTALHKVPFVYRQLAPGDWSIESSDLDDRTVRLDFRPFLGRWEYTVGQIEGVVLHYGTKSIIHVEELPEHHVRLDVEYRH